MSNGKVTIIKEVAEALEGVKKYYRSSDILREVITDDRCTLYGTEMGVLVKEYRKHGTDFLGLLMQALVNGYEIELSTQEELREYFHAIPEGAVSSSQWHKRYYVIMTLNILGITIEGINDYPDDKEAPL